MHYLKVMLIFSSVTFMIYSRITEWGHRIVILFMLTADLSTAWFFLPALVMLCFSQCTFWGWGKIFFYDCLCAIHDKMTPQYMRGPTTINQNRT